MKEFVEQNWVFALGFLSQGLFGVRLLVQWYLSEKQGRIVSPIIFWQLSVVACFFFIVYGILRNDFVIILGQALSYIIYVRNLQLEGAWETMPKPFRISAIALPLATMGWLFMRSASLSANFDFTYLLHPMVLSGAIGQLLLNFRFVYQWYYAEKTKTSVLPLGFWLMTSIGSVMVVVYALNRFDPVLLFAQSLGLLASLRNIQLHFKTKTAD
ncbi:MAG: lipid-A-disaccharide synthase N-terminal domain-containing protein [Bacteroidota bacterium]